MRNEGLDEDLEISHQRIPLLQMIPSLLSQHLTKNKLPYIHLFTVILLQYS